MSKESDEFEGNDFDLLKQLENILEHDPLLFQSFMKINKEYKGRDIITYLNVYCKCFFINFSEFDVLSCCCGRRDEVGFVHPSQFIALNEEASSMTGSVDVRKGSIYDGAIFWHKDHKLGISTRALLPLYKEAKRAFFSATSQSKSNGLFDGESVSSLNIYEMEIMKHSKALLLLAADFGTAWNSRKLIVSKKQFPMFMDELQLSELVLSYSPKSDHAWSHRRWVIKMIAGSCADLGGILEKESELVKKIAERYRMNYRAWNHRCWLVSYRTEEQILSELKSSRDWAGLHVADNSCFHYRTRLLLGVLKDKGVDDKQDYSPDIFQMWKEELDWNKTLIMRYSGREALWLHRRFLSQHWISNFMANSRDSSCPSKKTTGCSSETDSFLENELQLLESCSIMANDFEDVQAQVTFSLTYIWWLTERLPHVELFELQEQLKCLDVKSKLHAACPEKAFLWDYLID